MAEDFESIIRGKSVSTASSSGGEDFESILRGKEPVEVLSPKLAPALTGATNAYLPPTVKTPAVVAPKTTEMATATPKVVAPVKEKGILDKYMDWSRGMQKTVSDQSSRLITNIDAGILNTAATGSSALEWLGVSAAKPLTEKLAKGAQYYENIAAGNRPKDEQGKPITTYADLIPQGIGSTLPFMAGAFATEAAGGALGAGAAITRGLSILGTKYPKIAPYLGSASSWLRAGGAGIMEAASEAGGVYNQMINDKKTRPEAVSAADKTFLGNVVLITLTDKFGIFSETSGILKKAILHAAPMEGMQESAQQIISNVATGKPWGEGVWDSGLVGAIVGALLSPLGGAGLAQNIIKVIPENLRKEHEKKADEVKEEIKKIVKENPNDAVTELVNLGVSSTQATHLVTEAITANKTDEVSDDKAVQEHIDQVIAEMGAKTAEATTEDTTKPVATLDNMDAIIAQNIAAVAPEAPSLKTSTAKQIAALEKEAQAKKDMTVEDRIQSYVDEEKAKKAEKEGDISGIAINSLEKDTNGMREKSLTYFRENPSEITSKPIKLREVEEGQVAIEDGRHRLQIAKELGITPVFEDVTSHYTGKDSAKITKLIKGKTVAQKVEEPKRFQIVKNRQVKNTFETREAAEKALRDRESIEGKGKSGKVVAEKEKPAKKKKEHPTTPKKEDVPYVSEKEPETTKEPPTTKKIIPIHYEGLHKEIKKLDLTLDFETGDILFEGEPIMKYDETFNEDSIEELDDILNDKSKDFTSFDYSYEEDYNETTGEPDTAYGEDYKEVIVGQIKDAFDTMAAERDAELAEQYDKVFGEKSQFKQSSSFANMDSFRKTMEPIYKAQDEMKPMEFPELVRLAKDLVGEYPTVGLPRARMGARPHGLFIPTADGKIILNRDEFKQGNEEQIAKTLAHEIGHLIDYLPNKTMARGNLLGRLLTLNNFRKDFTEAAGASRTNKEVKEQMWNLSQYWRPVSENPSPAYMEYRKSAPEVYADFISALFVDPKIVDEIAPTAYNVFFEQLDAKPDVKQSYFELQDLLNGTSEELMAARQADIRKGFARGESIQEDFSAKKKLKNSHLWENLRQQLDDKNYPITKKQQQMEAEGTVFGEQESPKYALQESSMADNENFIMVNDINELVVKPLEKLLVTKDDIGEYLLLDRIINERTDIANPYGFNTKNAPLQIEHLKKQLGDKAFSTLEEKVKVFHDLIFKSVEEAVVVGSYNKELFETKILPNKDHYSSFAVLDYMQDFMPATIKAQTGTLKEVGNPFISTILKTISVNRLNAYQRAKNATLDSILIPTGDAVLTKVITTDGKLKKFIPGKDRGTIERLEDGKIVSYDVDPYIAKSFEHDTVGDLNMIVSIIDKYNNIAFKPIVTTYNLGFAMAFNPMRDFKRNYKNIPGATVGNLLTAYVKSVPSSVKFAKGELDSVTRSMVQSKLINSPMDTYNFDPAEDEFGRTLVRFGIAKENTQFSNKYAETARKTILKPVIKILEGIRFTANTFEVMSKIAGTAVRIQQGESGKSLAYNVRNYTGTPNYRVKGTQTRTTNAIFVFSNIMKEGLKSDYQIATRPNTRAGYWWKTVKIDLLPKFLMLAAAAGLAGDELKDWFENVSEYDKTNYIIIPLGYSNGKAVYIRIPHDETGRLISAMSWKMANYAETGKTNELQSIFALGAGQLPSVSPIIGVTANWLQYLSGRNPYDAFKGKNLIDETTWQAGGGAALKKMVQSTTNSLGLTKFATFDTSKNTGIETFMQVAPFFSSVVKISDYGKQEEMKAPLAEVRQKNAQRTLTERDIVQKYVQKADKAGNLNLGTAGPVAMEITKELLGHDISSAEEKATYDRIVQKVKLATKKQMSDDPRYISLIDATNEEKTALLNSIKEDSTPEEFEKIKEELLMMKIVTPKVINTVAN
jgi:hypothetical protein